MKTDLVMLAYFWLLSILASVFLGHEIGMMEVDKTRSIANAKLAQCNEVLMGGIYENRKGTR